MRMAARAFRLRADDFRLAPPSCDQPPLSRRLDVESLYGFRDRRVSVGRFDGAEELGRGRDVPAWQKGLSVRGKGLCVIRKS
jgi:hypothetical protein